MIREIEPDRKIEEQDQVSGWSFVDMWTVYGLVRRLEHEGEKVLLVERVFDFRKWSGENRKGNNFIRRHYMGRTSRRVVQAEPISIIVPVVGTKYSLATREDPSISHLKQIHPIRSLMQTIASCNANEGL